MPRLIVCYLLMNRGFNRSIQLNRWNLNYMLQKQQKSALLHASVMPFFFNNSTLYEQVVSSEGPSGHNVEYLLKLAEWMHKAVPDAWDEHLFSIEMEVRRMVAERGLCLTTLMGEKVEGLMAATSEGLTVSPSVARRGTFTTHACEKKCLKCIKL